LTFPCILKNRPPSSHADATERGRVKSAIATEGLNRPEIARQNGEPTKRRRDERRTTTKDDSAVENE